MPNRRFAPQTVALKAELDLHAPDGSEIRLLPSTERGSLCHCTLRPGQVSRPIRHRTVEEIWYVLKGCGEIWRKYAEDATIAELAAGVSLTIPRGCAFQFRNGGGEPLEILIITMPPWPGPEEAESVPGPWPVPDC